MERAMVEAPREVGICKYSGAHYAPLCEGIECAGEYINTYSTGIYYCFTLDCNFKISYVLKAKK